MKEIISIAPGRVCLFGDHQDYLGLPVIACAINRHIKLTAVENGLSVFNINKPDINKRRTIAIDQDLIVEKGDHLASALKVLKAYNCTPNVGYDITISGNLSINAGLSSSSAVVVAWVHFLLKAFGSNIHSTPELISQIAYEAEVLEHQFPGGKMDQYSIGIGNIVYLETGNDVSYTLIHQFIKGLIIGESGIPKNTNSLLKELKKNAWRAIYKVKENIDFDLKNAKIANLTKYLSYVPDTLQPYLIAAIRNYDITKRALIEFKKDTLDFKKIGSLINEHHYILKDILKITVPKIDAMIDASLEAGAYGAKIVGSGKGGSIVAIAPEENEQQVIDAIVKAGGNAYKVSVDHGARITEGITLANQKISLDLPL